MIWSSENVHWYLISPTIPSHLSWSPAPPPHLAAWPVCPLLPVIFSIEMIQLWLWCQWSWLWCHDVDVDIGLNHGDVSLSPLIKIKIIVFFNIWGLPSSPACYDCITACFRWDCEQTRQVWTACSTIQIQPKPWRKLKSANKKTKYLSSKNQSVCKEQVDKTWGIVILSSDWDD